METPERKWYQKKRYILGFSLAVLFVVGALGSSAPVPAPPAPSPVAPQVAGASYAAAPAVRESGQNADFSTGTPNAAYYTNVDGISVPSPAYSANGEAPAGATARCRDATYSSSLHRRGTCSGHGGVADWL